MSTILTSEPDLSDSVAPPRKYRKRRMDKPTGCDIEGCPRPHGTNGLCAPHYRRLCDFGDALAGPPLGPQRSSPGTYSGPDSEYQANHRRVRRARGAASGQRCERCPARAHDWATIHGKSGRDPGDYMPLCQKCHRRYDATTGRVQPPDERERRRQAQLKRYQDPAEREKTRQANLRRFIDPGEREKMRRAAEIRWSGPET